MDWARHFRRSSEVVLGLIFHDSDVRLVDAQDKVLEPV